MQVGNTLIVDTFAEAFRMVYTRVLITAINERWVDHAVRELCGYGSSVIACDAEAGKERDWSASETPDGRPGASALLFAFSPDALAKAVVTRIGQCVMTCPSTAVFNGLHHAESSFALGKHLRYFGDGFQQSKVIDGHRYWRIPVMDGEFLVEESLGVAKGIAGGNFLIQSTNQALGLAAGERAIDAIASLANVITPFPGGLVRSGSKVGSRYTALKASTADAWCPTLRSRMDTLIEPAANCVYEIVIDGSDEQAVSLALRVGIEASVGSGIVAIAAGNYGGRLGKFHFHLRKIMQ